MRLKRLSIQGIGVHHDRVELPIDELGDAKLVAIKGRNGTGKTTLIESAIPGATHLRLPSRGPLAILASSKDSSVESVIETDQEYTCRIMIDGVAKKKKTKAYLIDADGKAINESGGTRSYAAAVAERFPSLDVMLAGGFAAQKKTGSFLDVSQSDRRALFAEMLGPRLLRQQELSDAAGERAKTVRDDIRKKEAKAEALESTATEVDALDAKIAVATAAANGAIANAESIESAVKTANDELVSWQKKATELVAAHTAAEAHAHTLDDRSARQTDQLNDLRKRLTETQARRTGLEGRLSQRARLEADLESVPPGAADRIVVLEKAIADYQGLRDRWVKLDREHTNHTSDAEIVLAGAKTDHAVRTKAARDRHAAARADLARASDIAERLETVKCGGEGKYAECPLICAAVSARDSIDELTRLAKEAGTRLLATEPTPQAVIDAQAAIDALGPPPAKPKPPEEDHDRTIKHLRQLIANASEARGKLDGLADVEAQAETLDGDIARIQDQVSTTRADTEIASQQRAEATRAETAAMRAITDHEAIQPAVVDETDLAAAREAYTAAVASVARLEESLRAAIEAKADAQTIRAAITEATTELDDWTHLQQALGPRGLQALEIDSAAPEVSGLINDLLHSCYGPRFSCELGTTTMRADGSGTREDFDLRVIDTERGTDGSASQLSGGESVFVREAMSLAVAIYNLRQSSIPILDLWRDECAGALDVDNATRYVTMLRRAVDLGGFHRCYFVTHQPELWEMADAQLVFGGGKVLVA
jgi:exonuclease SbcC